MNVQPQNPQPGLTAACRELEEIFSNRSEASPEVISTAIERCCLEIREYFNTDPGNIPVEGVLDAVRSLKKAVAFISQRAISPQDKLAALQAAFWQQWVFPTIDNSLFNEKWHALVIQKDTSDNRATYTSIQATIRDLIKDDYLPFLGGGLAGMDGSQGLSLGPHLAFILHIASTAAELIGWRDPRADICPSMRNYSLINVSWIGAVKCWMAVPDQSRSLLSSAGLGAQLLAERLLSYLEKDFETLCQKKSHSDVKLLQFWAMNLLKFPLAYQEETSMIIWEGLRNWICAARHRVQELERSDTSAEAAAFLHAVRAGSLWTRIAKVQTTTLASPQVQETCIPKLVADLTSLRSSSSAAETPPSAAALLPAAAEILSNAGSLKEPAARAALMPVFKEILECVACTTCAPWVATAEQCQDLADCCLAYIISLAISDRSAPAFEEAQLLLLEHSLRPHPSMLCVLSTLWSSMAVLADVPTAKHFISAMHELLTATAAVEAAVECYPLPSAVSLQIKHLLAVLLGSVSAQIAEGYCSRYLAMSPGTAGDKCKLAALSAVLRATALSGHPTCCMKALILLRELSQALNRSMGNTRGGKSNKKSATVNGDSLQLAWLIDCLGAGLECLGAVASSESAATAEEMESAVADVARQAQLLLNRPDALSAPFLVPALKTLQLAWRLHPACLQHNNLEQLFTCLEKCLQIPAAAACIAGLTPALAAYPTAPKKLFEAMLGPSPSPSLQFLGREAYAKYASECLEDNVLGALPKSWIDPGSQTLSDTVRPIMQKYLERAPNSALDQMYGVDATAKVASELEKAASMAPARLHAAALKLGATLDPPPKTQEAALPAVNPALDALVADLVTNVAKLQSEWKPEALKGQGGEAAAMKLRQARDILSALLG